MIKLRYHLELASYLVTAIIIIVGFNPTFLILTTLIGETTK